MFVRTCTTRIACFCLALSVTCTLLVLRKVWYGLDSGNIQEGNAFCDASINSETSGLWPGSGCHGGLPVLPCDAMPGNRDNCSRTPTSLFWCSD